MPTTTRQWLLNGHPRGRGIEDGDFRLVETVRPAPGPGEMLIRLRWLGFDPAQKGWMENIADYVAPMAIGDVMRGSGIGEIVASNGGRFAVGELVFGTTGWTEYLVSDGRDLTKVETDLPPTAVLSVLGAEAIRHFQSKIVIFHVGTDMRVILDHPTEFPFPLAIQNCPINVASSCIGLPPQCLRCIEIHMRG